MEQFPKNETLPENRIKKENILTESEQTLKEAGMSNKDIERIQQSL